MVCFLSLPPGSGEFRAQPRDVVHSRQDDRPLPVQETGSTPQSLCFPFVCVTRTVLVNFKAFITLRIRIVLDAS